MKRWIFLFVILNSVTVFAQEISILGQKYSIIILLPLIFILIGLLFFVFIYIKDNMPNIGKIFKIFPKLKVKTKKDSRKRETKVKYTNYIAEFEKFKSRTKNLETKEKLSQFSGLVKDFLSFTFDIENQFAYNELISHINKGQDSILPFFKRLEDTKYSGEEISSKDLNKFLNEFEFIVKKFSRKDKIELGFIDKLKNKFDITKKFKIIKKDFMQRAQKEYLSNKIGFLEKLKILKSKKVEKPKVKLEIKKDLVKKKEEVKEIKEEIKVEDKRNFVYDIINNIKTRNKEIKLFKLIKNCERLSHSNPDKAKRIYSMILELYYQLPIEYEERFASKISELNNSIDEGISKKDEEEINRISRKMFDIVTSERKAVILHKNMPFFKNKIDDFVYSIKKLRVKSAKEVSELNKYFTNEFLDFLDEIKSLEKKGVRKIRKTKSNTIEELNDLLGSIKNAELKGIKTIKKDEEEFVDHIKEIITKLREIESNEAKLIKKKEEEFKDNISNVIKSMRKGVKERELEIKEKENDILEYLNKAMENRKKLKILEKPKVDYYKHEKKFIVENIEKPVIVKRPVELIPKEEVKPKIELNQKSFERNKLREIKIPKFKSQIEVDLPKKITKNYKYLDKEENDVFKKLIEVENESNFVEYKIPVIKLKRKSGLHNLEKTSHRMNEKIKRLSKEEELIYKKLIGVS